MSLPKACTTIDPATGPATPCVRGPRRGKTARPGFHRVRSLQQSLALQEFVYDFLRVAVLAIDRIIEALHLLIGNLFRQFRNDLGDLRDAAVSFVGA